MVEELKQFRLKSRNPHDDCLKSARKVLKGMLLILSSSTPAACTEAVKLGIVGGLNRKE
jgi:hypothetical protein